ncbi:S-layer homology domain-containing protein [Salisediminibacterium selenitireducens]|uniref:S-layer domain protein n=1 Tax=Bacillus selenitireducens (strain ATCC 700615 / DSM 15326 / MLS10) TaxID=439292 RepID=D6Y037_BACIE|nr:S-layer homology domain-containing protein [Salisediminibacterium selenitireducens]ADI00539.1 S-layer domain protein [[Bacillus] selenitireducens MLS10]
MKQVKRRVIQAVAALTMAAGFSLAADEAEAGGFSDFNEGFTEHDRVMDLVEQGVIQGFGDGSFKPRESIYRRDTARMFQRALDLRAGEIGMPFSDVSPSAGYAEAVRANYGAEIFLGSTAGTFGPADRLTREQMASVITRAYGLQSSGGEVPLNDLDQASPTHVDDIRTLYENGVTTGRADGSFAPGAEINRHEFAIMVSRAQEAVSDRGPRMLGGTVTAVERNAIQAHTKPYGPNTITFDLSALPGSTRIDGGTIDVSGDGEIQFDNIPGYLNVPDRQDVETGTNRLAFIDVMGDNSFTMNVLRSGSSDSITVRGTFTGADGSETPVRVIVKLR